MTARNMVAYACDVCELELPNYTTLVAKRTASAILDIAYVQGLTGSMHLEYLCDDCNAIAIDLIAKLGQRSGINAPPSPTV